MKIDLSYCIIPDVFLWFTKFLQIQRKITKKVNKTVYFLLVLMMFRLFSWYLSIYVQLIFITSIYIQIWEQKILNFF